MTQFETVGAETIFFHQTTAAVSLIQPAAPLQCLAPPSFGRTLEKNPTIAACVFKSVHG